MENAIAFYDKAIALAYRDNDTLKAVSLQFNKGVAYNSAKMALYKKGIEAFSIAADYFKKQDIFDLNASVQKYKKFTIVKYIQITVVCSFK